jgi:2,4-dienoyl-CoA reductase (NADPH2)
MSSGELHKKLRPFLRFFSPLTLEKLTRIWMPVGKKVVIIGGRIHGCETAEFLIKRRRQVTIIDTAEESNFGQGMTGDDKYLLFPWFEKKGVEHFSGVKIEGLTCNRLKIVTQDGRKLTLEADTFLSALPLLPNDTLMNELKDKAKEVYFIGDCIEPRLIAQATAAGSLIAHQI